ncbi:MAG: transporter ATP-binding protein [Candidatus Saccharibacteria bacterium]|nr:transporter ATP-binding protein [Candidatus Saccharibacteria bacterium]
MSIMAASIITNKLTKQYGSSASRALSELSLEIQPGEVYGFLGANGAGKSTTIRLLLNFLQPTSGSATILGLDSVGDSQAVKKHIGYLAGDIALYKKPTGKELLDFMSSLQPSTGTASYRKVLEKRFQADLAKPIGTLSKGNRQKIGIIQAFMHQPRVLILDEPTSGLDPLMQEAFYQTVAESKQQGAAILMSSHSFAEAEKTCDRIGIIRQGRLVLEQKISAESSLDTVIFRVTFVKSASLTDSKSASGLTFVSQTDSHSGLYKPSGSIGEALKALSRYDISELSTQKLDLEDEFLEYYGATE